jgi:hypothetical protein
MVIGCAPGAKESRCDCSIGTHAAHDTVHLNEAATASGAVDDEYAMLHGRSNKPARRSAALAFCVPAENKAITEVGIGRS